MSLDPVILQGTHVRLEPLSLAHLDQLCEIGLEPMIVHDGRYRHSVYYSVIVSEWPEVRSNLEQRLR